MNKRTVLLLVVGMVCLAVLGGCVPEEVVEWSDDGTVGVSRHDGMMSVVDGKTGAMRVISENDHAIMDSLAISGDGTMVACVLSTVDDDLDVALGRLPESQQRFIRHQADIAYDIILKLGVDKLEDEFPMVKNDKAIGDKDLNCTNWIVRYLCEKEELYPNVEGEFTEEMREEGKRKKLLSYQVVVRSVNALTASDPLVSSLFMLSYPKLSKDKKYVSYLMLNESKGEAELGFDLCVTDVERVGEIVLVVEKVAVGYDWREDSQAIVCMKNDMLIGTVGFDGVTLGTLCEVDVVGDDGAIEVKELQALEAEYGATFTSRCDGEVHELAGFVFQVMMKACYGAGGRILFSCYEVRLPASKIDNVLMWSLYSFDPETMTVTNVLPLRVSSQLVNDNACGYFALSPDKKKVILPMRMHQFMIYSWGESNALIPIYNEERFGDSMGDNWRMLPSWKGNDEITCLLGTKSRFWKDWVSEEERAVTAVVLTSGGDCVRRLPEVYGN